MKSCYCLDLIKAIWGKKNDEIELYFRFQVWPFSFQQHIDNKQLATVSLNQWLSRGDTNDIYLHTQSSSTKNLNNFMNNSPAHL